jgi:hypothetical protein
MSILKKEEMNFICVVLLFLVLGFFFAGWPFVRLTLAFSFLFLLPGRIFIRIMFPQKSFSLFAQLPLSYCLGFSILAIPGIIAYFVRPTLTAFSIFYVLLVLAFCVLFLRLERREKISAEKNSNRDNSVNIFLRIFVILVILASVILVLRMGSTYRGDALGHIGKIQHFFNYGVDPTDYIIGDGIRVVYGFSIWHLGLALLFKLAFVSPAVGWFYLAALFTPLSLLAFFSLARELIQSEEAASLSLVVFILLKLGGETAERFLQIKVGWLTLGQWRTMAYPYAHTLYIFIPMVLLLILGIYRKQEKNLGLTAGLFALTIAAIHPLGLFSLAWALLCFVVFTWIFDGKKEILAFKNIIWGFVIIPLPYILLKAIIYVQYRLSLSTSLVEAVSRSVNKDLSSSLEQASDLFSFVNLNAIFSNPKIAFSTGLSLFFLLFFLKTHKGAKFLFSNVLFTIAVALMPVLSTILISAISLNLYVRSSTRWLYFIGAICLGWFFYEVFVFFRRWALEKLPGSRGLKDLFGQILMFVWVIFMISGVLYLNLFSFMGVSSSQARDVLGEGMKFKPEPGLIMNNVSAFISEHVPPKSYFLVHTENDRKWQLEIGLTGNHALSSIARSGSVFLKISPQQKLRFVSQILSEETDDSKVVSLIDELGLDYVLIQKTREASLARLGRIEKLTKIFEDPSFVIFQFTKTG